MGAWYAVVGHKPAGLTDLWHLMVCIIEGIMPDGSRHQDTSAYVCHMQYLVADCCVLRQMAHAMQLWEAHVIFEDRQPHKASVHIHFPRANMSVFFPHHTGLYSFHVKQLPTHQSIFLQHAGRHSF